MNMSRITIASTPTIDRSRNASAGDAAWGRRQQAVRPRLPTLARLALALLGVCGSAASAGAADGNISLENLRIPRAQIRSGGPPKDGIPALTDPQVISAAQAESLAPTERVIGVSVQGEQRAYPLRILNYHEIVNDTLGGVPIAVTYCPLCDSAVVFRRKVQGQVLEFGVSGMLYQSNVLMYDRSHGVQSLWSQMAGRAISGPFSGTRLVPVPVKLTSWGRWRKEHPATTVLGPQTGHRRRYQVNPYADYFRSPELMFPVAATDPRLPPKSRVLGVVVGDEAKAYPLPDPNPERGMWQDNVGGRTLRLATAADSGNIRLIDPPKDVRIAYSLWFTWYAFHQDTQVHSYPQ